MLKVTESLFTDSSDAIWIGSTLSTYPIALNDLLKTNIPFEPSTRLSQNPRRKTKQIFLEIESSFEYLSDTYRMEVLGGCFIRLD